MDPLSQSSGDVTPKNTRTDPQRVGSAIGWSSVQAAHTRAEGRCPPQLNTNGRKRLGAVRLSSTYSHIVGRTRTANAEPGGLSVRAHASLSGPAGIPPSHRDATPDVQSRDTDSASNHPYG